MKTMITVEIDATGRVVAFSGMDNDGQVVETCRTNKEPEAVQSHTWEVSSETYLVVRDILFFSIKADWQEGQII